MVPLPPEKSLRSEKSAPRSHRMSWTADILQHVTECESGRAVGRSPPGSGERLEELRTTKESRLYYLPYEEEFMGCRQAETTSPSQTRRCVGGHDLDVLGKENYVQYVLVWLTIILETG